MRPEMPDPAIGRAFGDAIRSAREHAGYTQRSLADHAGIALDDYAAIERGERQLELDTIVQIAAALNVSAAELFKRAKL
jgi:transcriptional regulator with XRE-family HTH domain